MGSIDGIGFRGPNKNDLLWSNFSFFSMIICTMHKAGPHKAGKPKTQTHRIEFLRKPSPRFGGRPLLLYIYILYRMEVIFTLSLPSQPHGSSARIKSLNDRICGIGLQGTAQPGRQSLVVRFNPRCDGPTGDQRYRIARSSVSSLVTH